METGSPTKYFRVPASFQVIIEPLASEEQRKERELEISFPSPHSSLRSTLETQVRGGDMDLKNQELISRAFELLLSMEQRLHRLEDFLIRREKGEKPRIYHWVKGEIGGEGCLIDLPSESSVSLAEVVGLDILLPCVPEYRIQMVGEVTGLENSQAEIRFLKIHPQDLEQVFRFIRQRERELIRQAQAPSA
jgi:hypothetical protein